MPSPPGFAYGLHAPAPPSQQPPYWGFQNVAWRRLGLRTAALCSAFAATWYVVDRLPYFVEQRAQLSAAVLDAPAQALPQPPVTETKQQ